MGPSIQNMNMLGLILNASLVALAAGAAFHQPGSSGGCDIPPEGCRRWRWDWNWSTGGCWKCIEKINIEPVDLEKFRQDSLRAHNAYRSKHGVPALKLSDKINAVAQEWADYLIANDSTAATRSTERTSTYLLEVRPRSRDRDQLTVGILRSRTTNLKTLATAKRLGTSPRWCGREALSLESGSGKRAARWSWWPTTPLLETLDSTMTTFHTFNINLIIKFEMVLI